MNRRRALAALAVLACAAARLGAASPAAPAPSQPAKGQAPAPSPQPPAQKLPAAAQVTPAPAYAEEFSVGWVLVPVIVRSQSGYIENLRRDDFQLLVDRQPVRFRDFERRGEAPLSLVFLQDLSGSMGLGGRLDASREAAEYFFEKAHPGDEYAIATFAGNETQVDVPFTEDLGALREAVHTWEAYGRTALNDAVAWLPDISVKSHNVKRAALLVTDGVDNASTISANEAREMVRRAALPVYVLGLESGDPYAVQANGKKVYRYADVLNLLAAMTGGRYFAISSPEDVKEACATISEDLRYQYVLSFETAAAGKSQFRPIEVRVKSKKATAVWTRRGYEGTAPSGK